MGSGQRGPSLVAASEAGLWRGESQPAATEDAGACSRTEGMATPIPLGVF